VKKKDTQNIDLLHYTVRHWSLALGLRSASRFGIKTKSHSRGSRDHSHKTL
jgi:hypothetical protein